MEVLALDPPGEAEIVAAGSISPEGLPYGEGWKSALGQESLEEISREQEHRGARKIGCISG